MIVRKQTQTCIRTIKLYNVRIIQTQSNIFLLILEYYTYTRSRGRIENHKLSIFCVLECTISQVVLLVGILGYS